MNATNDIANLMIQNELKAFRGAKFVISNHHSISPYRVELEPDETAFITCIRVSTEKGFILDFHSATESRKIEAESEKPTIIEDNICTRHKGNIYFRINTGDVYEITYIIIKILKP